MRGISTEAWIAPRNFSGDTIMMEWHFMSNGWTSVETAGAIAGEPIASYFYFKKNIGISSETVEIYFTRNLLMTIKYYL